MNLYLIKRKGDVGYDETGGFVVRADTPKLARKIAAENCADEGAGEWLSADASSCKELSSDGAPGVVLTDHRAG